MHRLIASSCLQIINHFHRLEPLASSRVKWKHDEMGWASKVWLPIILHAQVVLVLRKQQSKPSLYPSLPLPSAFSLSPPLLSRLFEGITCSHGLHFFLSQPLIFHRHLHRPSNTTFPRLHSMILCPTLVLIRHHHLPSSINQETELGLCSPFCISCVSGTTRVL